MDNEMMKQAAYAPIAGHIANALLNQCADPLSIVDQTVELTKAIVDKLYA